MANIPTLHSSFINAACHFLIFIIADLLALLSSICLFPPLHACHFPLLSFFTLLLHLSPSTFPYPLHFLVFIIPPSLLLALFKWYNRFFSCIMEIYRKEIRSSFSRFSSSHTSPFFSFWPLIYITFPHFTALTTLTCTHTQNVELIPSTLLLTVGGPLSLGVEER